MNGIWGGMLLVGIIYGVMTGRTEAVSAAVLDSSRDAVTLCITMLGITGLWMGLMQIAQAGGAVSVISAKMKPLIRFLFPGIPENHPASGAITLNFAANFLGLGWAATPAGLQAMKELEALREQKGGEAGTASDEMCAFLILNISSLQLIPVTVIAYRSQYHSADPAVITGPAIAATAVSTAAAVLFVKWAGRKRKRRKKKAARDQRFRAVLTLTGTSLSK